MRGHTASPPDARFCVECGWPLTDVCPTCATRLQLGGGNLENGRCPTCSLPLAVCPKSNCGRLLPADIDVCPCLNRTPLPPPAPAWSTLRGPADGTGSLAVSAVPGGEPEEFSPDGAEGPLLAFGALDVAGRAAVIGELGLYSLADRRLSLVTNDLDPARGATSGAGRVLAFSGRSMAMWPPEEWEARRLPQPVAAHLSHGVRWWVVHPNGSVVNMQGQVLGTLPASPRASLVAQNREVFAISGGEAVAVRQDRLDPVGVGVPEGEPFVIGERLHLTVREAGQLYVYRPEGAFKWTSQGIPSNGGPWLVDGERLWALPPEGGQIGSLDLKSGAPALNAELDSGTLLAAAGLRTPKGFRILVASVRQGRGKAYLLDPVQGGRSVLSMSDEAAEGWTAAHWAVLPHRTVLVLRRGEATHVLAYDMQPPL